jgi:uncharacterized iron-regulated membrane protein
MTWKRLFLQIHRWIGLVAALFLSVQALTGLLIVFHDDLGPLLQPGAYRGGPQTGPLDFDRILAAAQADHPRMKIARIEMPPEAGRAVEVRLAGEPERLVTVDPAPGVVLADRPRTAFPAEWLYELHTHFLQGERGRWLIGFNGLALTFLGLSGPIAWWPGRGRLSLALKAPPLKGPAFRLVANLHRFAGIYLSLLLLVIGLTGLTLVFMPEATKVVAGRLPTASAPKLPAVARPPTQLIPVNAAVAIARRQIPDRRLKSVRFSGPKGQLVRVVFKAEGGHERRIDQVWIDRGDGRVLGVQRADAAPSGTRLLSWVLPLHAGEIYGWAAKPVALTGGVALLLFAGSGSWLYLRRAVAGRAKR